MENEKKERILIVDDTVKNIQILGQILQKAGYQVNVAQNGVQALKSVSTILPDLILLDIMMPEMDGYETCEKLKADPKSKDIPIIFLTAKVETDDIVNGFAIGAVDYVTKPFNSAELLSRVNTHLQLKHKTEQLAVLANKLSKYLSPQVYNSIFTGAKDVKLESSRKRLTVCFADIVDFTPKSEDMDQVEFTQWINSYLNQMAKITLEHGGTLDKFMGDAVMVFFGDPASAGEQEDAIQCVKMAIAMQRYALENGILIRIGVHTGECTVGNFGSNERMDYTIIGKNVNLGARLEQNSDSGKILISDATYELVKDAIPCERRGHIRVKGIDREILTYWVPIEL